MLAAPPWACPQASSCGPIRSFSPLSPRPEQTFSSMSIWARGTQAACAVRNARRTAHPWRCVEPLDQRDFLRVGFAVAGLVPLERIQASIFVPRDANPMPILRRFRTAVTINDLKDTISRYLGVERTERSFQSFELSEGGRLNGSEPASMAVIRFSEQLLASAVGSSSARLILSLLFQRNDRTPKDAFRLLDDATEALQHNRDLLRSRLTRWSRGSPFSTGIFA